jgi:hypothetical protein
MIGSGKTNGFHRAIEDNESLSLVLRKIAEFDSKFCELMAKGSEFTIRLEVRGNVGEIVHVRVNADDLSKPRGSLGRIDKKQNSAIAKHTVR